MFLFRFIFSWQFWISLILSVAIILGIAFTSLSFLSTYTDHGKEVTIPEIEGMNIQDAIKLVSENNLEFQIDSFKYDSIYKPFEVISVHPIQNSKVKRGRKIFIRCNPKTWKPIVVPNLIDKSKYLAFSQLEILGLKVGDTLYEANISQDRVLRMLYKGKEIKPGDTVPKFSSIDLVIGLGLLRDAVVPNLIGLDYESAKRIIEQNYFSTGILHFNEKNDTLNTRIYYQEPIPNSKLDQGLSINLWLSEKPQEELQQSIDSLDEIYNPEPIDISEFDIPEAPTIIKEKKKKDSSSNDKPTTSSATTVKEKPKQTPANTQGNTLVE
ncbi:MAG: PASTA domain-containing protein [Flavobacteriales bacterium]|nr:PASTA domain-containing protein [Flavobacteriales bacterium]